jgi:hypothetical protein
MNKDGLIEVYEWKKGDRRPPVLSSDGLLAYLAHPAGVLPNLGDTVLLSGSTVGEPDALVVPYRVIDRVFTWIGGPERKTIAEVPAETWSKVWLTVERIDDD